MRSPWRMAALAALTAVCFAGQAQSADPHKAAAVALYNDAEKLMAEQAYAAACPKYAESNRLDPQLGALVHLADCYEKNGQLASAWASWRDAVEIAQAKGDPRQTLATQRAAALEPRLARMVVEVPRTSDVAGLEVRRDGAAVSRPLWGTPVPVDKGEHVIEATAPGRKAVSVKVQVERDGVVITHRVGLLEEMATAAPAAPPVSSVQQNAGPEPGPVPAPPAAGRDSVQTGHGSGGTQRTLGWIAAGVGVLGLGAGILFDSQRRNKESDRAAICPSNLNCTADDVARIDSLNSDVKGSSSAETVSFVAGGVLLAGGLALVLTAPSGHSNATSLSIAPQIGRGSGGLTASAVW